MLKSFKKKINICNINTNFKRIGKSPPGYDSRPGKYNTITREKIKKAVIKENIISQRKFEDLNKSSIGTVAGNFLCKAPFSGYSYYVVKNYRPQILQALRFLLRLFRAEKAEVVLPASEKEMINEYSASVEKLPNIFKRVVKDRYPISNEEIFKRHIYRMDSKEKLKNSYWPVLQMGPLKLIKLFYAVASPKDIKYIDTAVVTENKKFIISYDRQSSVKEFFNYIGITISDNIVVKNSLLHGSCVSDIEREKLNDSKTFFIINETGADLLNCIYCGRCVQLCPKQLDKTFAMETLQKEKGILNFSDTEGCISCGLCGYFCPGFKMS